MDLWNIDTCVAFGSQLKARDKKLIINSTKKMEGESLTNVRVSFSPNPISHHLGKNYLRLRPTKINSELLKHGNVSKLYTASYMTAAIMQYYKIDPTLFELIDHSFLYHGHVSYILCWSCKRFLHGWNRNW